MKQSKVGMSDDRPSTDVVTAAQLFDAVRTRLHLVFAIAAAVALAMVVIVFLITARFTSEAQLLLESRESVYTRALGDRELPGGVFDEQAVASQVQVIASRDVAREAIRRLGLVGHPEFDPLVGPIDPLTRIKMMVGASRGVFGGAEEERIFESYYQRLTVFPVARSRVIAIRFSSADPDLAARAANTIAQVYLEQLEEAKTDLARAASTWLGTSIEDLRDRVSAAEAEVEEFRARSGLLVGGNNATITSQQLSDINTELAQARSAQADSQARARLISDMIATGRAFEIPDVANNETIVRLLEQRVGLRSQLALEQRTLLPQHPRILELRAQLTDLDAEIRTAAERTVRILENDARLAGARVESLEAALAAQMRVVAQANENEVRLRAMEREARAEREQLETYLARYREAVARGAQSASLPDARIVSRAVASPEPSFPRKVPMIVLATFAAVFLTVGFIVVRELAFGPTEAIAAETEFHSPSPTGGSAPALAQGARQFERGSWFSRFGRKRPRRAAAAAERAPEFDATVEEAVVEEATVEEATVEEAGAVAAAPAGLLRGTFAEEPDVAVAEDREAALEIAQVPVVEHSAEASPATSESIQAKADIDVSPIAAFETDEEEEAAAFTARGAAASPERQTAAPPAEPIQSDSPEHDMESMMLRPSGGKAAEPSEAAYRFDALIARIAMTPVVGRGRRVLVTGLGDPSSLSDLARQFARSVARENQTIIIATQRDRDGADGLGLTDLIADNASFFHVIQNDGDAPLHRVDAGTTDPRLIVEEPDALEISLAAFDQTYEWVVLSMPDPSDVAAYRLFAKSVDNVVLASDQEPSNPAVLALYDAARRAGAPQVVVAHVGEVAKAAAA